jgi:CubicO group peptidase (beta-lactamase class C family)
VPLVALAAVLAACGAGTVPPTAAPSGPVPTAQPEAYARCMRAHGVPDFPDPVGGHITLSPAGGADPASPAFQAASRACLSLSPSGPGPGASVSGPTPTSATTSVPAATWRDFGGWLAARATAGQFSGAVLVSRAGQTPLEAGYGLADRGHDVANTAETRICVASIGKLFTAVAIARLVQEHRLEFGDTIGTYLTGFAPAVADQVTIADLLDMTSGLGDVALAGPHPPTTLAGQVALIAKEPFRFAPGSAFGYSNDGYIVLGAIIERVSGQPYASYVRQHVLEPAGMAHTDLDPYVPASVSGMAHGYVVGAAGAAPRDVSGQLQVANPSGGASSTVGDLRAFAEALLTHRLLTPAMTTTVLTPRVDAAQPGGPPVDKYTYGFAYQAVGSATFVGHNGGTPGYEGQIDIYPGTGYVVVILTNQDRTLLPAIQRSEAILANT